MAHVKDNALTAGLRGMLGNRLVFRTVRGKTIVSNRPKPPRKQSQRQRENRIHFRCASMLAQAALQDPQRKQYYTLKARKLNLPNAYTAALTDHLRKPTVSTVKQSDRHGRISVTASKKDFALNTVEVMITNTRGETLSTHPASMNERKRNEWTAVLPKELYSGSVNNNNGIEPYHLWVSVKDRAGNVIRIHQPFTAGIN
jgi:hypothetical protein